MKFCFCSIAFREEPIESIVPRLAEIGYDGVEIWWQHVAKLSDQALADLKTLAAEADIRLEVISPYFWLTQNEKLLKESLETAEQVVRVARLLGVPKVRTFTDAGPTGIGSAVATPELWDQAVQALRKITAMGPELDFVVETHAKTLADTVDSTLSLLERVGAPNLAVIFQAMNEATAVQDFRKLGSHVHHVHLGNEDQDGKPVPLHEGIHDLGAFLKAIKQGGYTGTVSVEYCHRGSTWEQAAATCQWIKSFA